MTSPPQGTGNTDNISIREIRDILKESKKQSMLMVGISIAVFVMTLIQLVLFIYQL